MKLQACRIPPKKMDKLLTCLEGYLSVHPYSFSVSRKDLNSISGKLLYFAKINLFIRPLLDPLIRLKCLLPDKPYLKHVNFRVANFGSNLLFEVLTVIKLLLSRLRGNKFVSFDWFSPLALNFMTHVYTDASGEDFGCTNYGIGIFLEDFGAFQINRNIYTQFLYEFFVNQPDPIHINHQELLAFILAVWLLVTKFRRACYNRVVQFRLDNQTCFYNIGKNRFRNNFAANQLLLTAGDMLFRNKTRHHLLWIPSEEMATCFADSLSRHFCSEICFKGKVYAVNHFSYDDFHRFKAFFTSSFSGMNEDLVRMIAIPDIDCRENYFSIYWISILLYAARSSSTHNKLSTYGNYFKLFKQSRGITGSLFSASIGFEERLLLYFAINLLILSKYLVKTAKTIVYQAIRHESLGSISCSKQFLILADLFKGASKLLRRDHKNRLILSPATLKIFNVTLD